MNYSVQTSDVDINQQPQLPSCLRIFLLQVEGSGWVGRSSNNDKKKKKYNETNRLPGFMHREQIDMTSIKAASQNWWPVDSIANIKI